VCVEDACGDTENLKNIHSKTQQVGRPGLLQLQLQLQYRCSCHGAWFVIGAPARGLLLLPQRKVAYRCPSALL